MKKLFQLLYLAGWFVRARMLGQHIPLQSVIFVTGGCNSTCRHCVECRVPAEHFKSYAQIERDLAECFRKGARILDIEGVNLLRWHDSSSPQKTLPDIFRAAREIGFYNISTMVPAADWEEWSRLQIEADVIWVSISGVDDLQILDKKNNLLLYFVINRERIAQLPQIMEYCKAHTNITQIAFNFHTPFAGTEELELRPEERSSAIESIIEYKKRGYPVMNTVSGLKNMSKLRFKRYCWICNFVYCNGRRSDVCIDEPQSGICSKCGFSMSGEMNALFRFKPDTILAGLKSRG